jgi:hypothetical protein
MTEEEILARRGHWGDARALVSSCTNRRRNDGGRDGLSRRANRMLVGRILSLTARAVHPASLPAGTKPLSRLPVPRLHLSALQPFLAARTPQHVHVLPPLVLSCLVLEPCLLSVAGVVQRSAGGLSTRPLHAHKKPHCGKRPSTRLGPHETRTAVARVSHSAALHICSQSSAGRPVSLAPTDRPVKPSLCSRPGGDRSLNGVTLGSDRCVSSPVDDYEHLGPKRQPPGWHPIASQPTSV